MERIKLLEKESLFSFTLQMGRLCIQTTGIQILTFLLVWLSKFLTISVTQFPVSEWK